MILRIDPQGQVRCLYSELIDLAELGPARIRRASHVEPDRRGRWWADLGPVGGPRLGPFSRRTQALALEVKWLEGHGIPDENDLKERTGMGLTIHYQLKTHLQGVEDIRFALDSLRKAAAKLPFKEVGSLLEFTGKDVDHEDKEDPYRWLKIQAGQHVEVRDHYVRVEPLHLIGFETWPGEGCEPANFGLCLYPASAMVEVRPGRRRSVPTGLTGWRWGSCCKTQYASDPACGGIANFLRCHLLVIQMLDLFAKSGWFEVTVSDEGDYWEHRDPQKLARTVGEWNEGLAALVGQFKDAAGQAGLAMESPITRFANFEHLEAKGQERLSKDS